MIFELNQFHLVTISELTNLLGEQGRSPHEIFSILPKRFTNFEHPKWNMIKQKYIGDHFKIKGRGGVSYSRNLGKEFLNNTKNLIHCRKNTAVNTTLA